MGGGGSGRRIREERLSRLEDLAKQKISEAGEPTRRNVFISFAGEDLDEVNLLRGQAKDKTKDLVFNDRSLHEPFDSRNADYIRQGIRDRIRQSSVTIVYLSESSAESDWVDWEIRESKRQDKGVIALHKGDNPPANLPPAVKEFGIEVVRWSHEALMAAIDKAAQER